MLNETNQIVLKYKNALISDYSPVTKGTVEGELIVAFLANLSDLGYTLSADATNYLSSLSKGDCEAFTSEAITTLKAALGDDVKYRPLFRDFPNEPEKGAFFFKRLIGVFSIVHAQYFYGLAFNHLTISDDLFDLSEFNADPITGRQYNDFDLPEIEREKLEHKIKALKSLEIVNSGIISELYPTLLSGKGSLSESDKNWIALFIGQYYGGLTLVPAEIPQKETAAFVLGNLLKLYSVSEVLPLGICKTATDLLRVAEVLSGGDPSLAPGTHVKFKLKNAHKHFIMASLNGMVKPEEDMLRFKALWLILGKALHVGAYKTKYPNAFNSMNLLRNAPEKIETFNSKIESILNLQSFKYAPNVIDQKNLDKLLKLAQTRPGDFARRLDNILSKSKDQVAVANAFVKVADKVATPILLNLIPHFTSRKYMLSDRIRTIIPKGKVAFASFDKDAREALNSAAVSAIVKGVTETLVNKFKEGPSLGNVYIDPNLQNVIIPTNMRAASASLHTLARGTRIPLDENAKVVRLFLYWEDIKDSKNYNNRVDVDLSTKMYGDSLNDMGVVSYYNLSESGIKHSGDITSAPKGAAEFIDVDIEKAIKRGYRYVGVTVNSFTGQKFSEFTAKAGMMVRQNDSGKFFEPKTVEQKYDLTAETTFNVPMVFDLHTKEMIWLDMGIKDLYAGANIGHTGDTLSNMIRYANSVGNEKNNLFELFNLHATARGSSVSYTKDEKTKYDTVFDMSMAGKTDEILSAWL